MRHPQATHRPASAVMRTDVVACAARPGDRAGSLVDREDAHQHVDDVGVVIRDVRDLAEGSSAAAPGAMLDIVEVWMTVSEFPAPGSVTQPAPAGVRAGA